MSLNVLNYSHETIITAYNESEPVRIEGGIVERTKSTEISLRILKMHQRSRELRDKTGQRYIVDAFDFQVSKNELTSKSFELLEGRTHFIDNENNYRVMDVIDYSMYPLTKVIQGRAVREILVD